VRGGAGGASRACAVSSGRHLRGRSATCRARGRRPRGGVPIVVDAGGARPGVHTRTMPPARDRGGRTRGDQRRTRRAPRTRRVPWCWTETRPAGPGPLGRAFEATHTTARGLDTGEHDAAPALLARDGKDMCARLLRAVAAASRGCGRTGTRVPGRPPAYEPCPLVVMLAGPGANGSPVEADLMRAGMRWRWNDRGHSSPESVRSPTTRTGRRVSRRRWYDAVSGRGPPAATRPGGGVDVVTETVSRRREAFFAPNKTVPADAASDGSATS